MWSEVERRLITIGATVALVASGGCKRPEDEVCDLHDWSIDCVEVDPRTGETTRLREPPV